MKYFFYLSPSIEVCEHLYKVDRHDFTLKPAYPWRNTDWCDQVVRPHISLFNLYIPQDPTELLTLIRPILAEQPAFEVEFKLPRTENVSARYLSLGLSKDTRVLLRRLQMRIAWAVYKETRYWLKSTRHHLTIVRHGPPARICTSLDSLLELGLPPSFTARAIHFQYFDETWRRWQKVMILLRS